MAPSRIWSRPAGSRTLRSEDIGVTANRDEANRLASERLSAADPILVDVQRALDAVPGMKANLVLTSGAPLPWEQYSGPQRAGILQGAVDEGLAATPAEAEEKLRSGQIEVGSTLDHGCIEPAAGTCTASMSVFVVENRSAGNRACCALHRGETAPGQARLVDQVVAPMVGEAVRRRGGVPLRPIIGATVRFGDELHMRAAAASVLWTTEIFPALLDVAKDHEKQVRSTIEFLDRNRHAWFVRLAMAASRSIAGAADGVDASSVVTAMAVNCKELAIRVSGLGDEWFRGPRPRLDPPGGVPDGGLEIPGGDCVVAESVGLSTSTGARPAGELAECSFAYWGVEPGIDLFKVLESGAFPRLTAFVSDRQGALGGMVPASSTLECFDSAAAAYRRRWSA